MKTKLIFKALFVLGSLLLGISRSYAIDGSVSVIDEWWDDREDECYGIDPVYYEGELIGYGGTECPTPYHYQTVQAQVCGLDPDCTYDIYIDNEYVGTSTGNYCYTSTADYLLNTETPPSVIYTGAPTCPCDPYSYNRDPISATSVLSWGTSTWHGATISSHSQGTNDLPLGKTTVHAEWDAALNCDGDGTGYHIDIAVDWSITEYWYGSNVYGFNSKSADVQAVVDGEAEHYNDAETEWGNMDSVFSSHSLEWYALSSEGSGASAASSYSSAMSSYWSAYVALANSRDFPNTGASLAPHPTIADKIINHGGY